ncbi:ribonuclease H-like domain-containing protein [Tanacetum coccineum]
MLSRSSAKAEYRGVANAITETCWLRNLLHELQTPVSSATLVYCDIYADIFTKGLPSTSFEEFRNSLSIRCPLALTTRSRNTSLHTIDHETEKPLEIGGEMLEKKGSREKCRENEY